MLEIYLDSRGEAALENYSSIVRAFPRDAKRATASSMKSEGNRLRGLIKAAIQKKGLHGEWQDLNPHTGILSKRKGRGGRRNWIKNFKWGWKGKKGNKKKVKKFHTKRDGRWYRDVMLSTRSNPMAKLAGAVRYSYNSDMQQVNIGFTESPQISRKLIAFAFTHAKGFETPITPKMRKMLFGMGFPIKKSTTSFKTPPRPVVGPVFEQEKNRISQNLERKFLESLQRYWNERGSR